MARYDYACTGCSLAFEVQHTPQESPLIACPQCGGIAEKTLNPSSVQFRLSSDQANNVQAEEAAAHSQENCTHPGCAWHRPLSDWKYS